MPWSVVKRKLWLEKKALAGQFLEETEANLKNLAETKLLATKTYDLAAGADQLQLFPEETGRQIDRAYEKVATINDALVKYQKFRSSSAGDHEYEKKSAEFQQFLAWYRGGLLTSLQNLAAKLKDEAVQKEEEDKYTP